MSDVRDSRELTKVVSESAVLEKRRGLLFRLVALAVVVLLAGQITIARFALTGFEGELEAQLYQKAHLIGNSIADQITYAVVELGYMHSDLQGVNEYLEGFLEDNSDIEFLALVDSAGNAMFSSGIDPPILQSVVAANAQSEENFSIETAGYYAGSFPVYTFSGETVQVFVGVSSEHVRNQFSEIFFELIVIVAVLCLITVELIVFSMSAYYFEPIAHLETVLSAGKAGIFSRRISMRARGEVDSVVGAINRMLFELERRYADFVFEVQELKTIQFKDEIAEKIELIKDKIDKKYLFSGNVMLTSNHAAKIRIPLFLFIFAEELSRSFLPLFISRQIPLETMIANEWFIGLPITLCMLAAMAVTPIGGGLTDRYGEREVFLAGIAFALIGFVGTFFTQGYVDLVIWRVVTGVGYGLVFTASEAWVAHHSGEGNRASNAAIFVAAVFVGIICGPPIGGIVADRIGYEATFLISAALAVVSGILVLRIFKFYETGLARRMKPWKLMLNGSELSTLLRNKRFFAVLFLASIPNKMILSGFLFYLVPLYMSQLGHTQSSIGRTMMLYGLITLAGTKIAARLADKFQNYEHMVITSGVVAGAGFLVSMFDFGASGATIAIVVAILCMGFGHSLAFSSQHSIVQIIAEEHNRIAGRATILSTYRVFERSGMVIGPMIVVALTTNLGYRAAIVAIGVIMIVLTIIYALTVRSVLADKVDRQIAEPEIMP